MEPFDIDTFEQRQSTQNHWQQQGGDSGKADQSVELLEEQAFPASLRDFLSVRIEQANKTNIGASPNADTLKNPFEIASTVLGTRHNGYMLNAMDTLENAGIEHLLPTPSIRLNVIARRLKDAIETLENRLEQYHQLHTSGPEVKRSSDKIKHRLLVLKRHQRQVERQLDMLRAGRPSMVQWMEQLNQFQRQLQELQQKALQSIAPGKILDQLDPEAKSFRDLNTRIRAIADVLNEQVDNPDFSAAEISELVSQYDRLLTQASTLATHIGSRKSWREHVNDRLQIALRNLHS